MRRSDDELAEFPEVAQDLANEILAALLRADRVHGRRPLRLQEYSELALEVVEIVERFKRTHLTWESTVEEALELVRAAWTEPS